MLNSKCYSPTTICTLKELNEAFRNNNIKRDKNLDDKLLNLKEEIVVHLQKEIADIPAHKTSPETRAIFNEMKDNCSKTTNIYNLNQKLMQRDIEEIKQYIIEDKLWKEKTWEKIDKKFVSKDEFQPIKDKVNKLIGFLWALLITCGVIVSYWILKNSGIPTP